MTTFRTPTRIAPSPAAGFIPGRRTVVHLAPDQGMATRTLDEEAWADLGGLPAFGDGRVLSVFDYESTWTWWERHPGGEELVLVLSGCVRFHLDDGAPWVVALSGGEATLVPRGTWHRAEIAEPSRMLFVTPAPVQTEHRDA
jgi:mannose-6-phosphate isomerase-like protein (cupin superfamily)